jgi:hypothetical protein
LSAYRTDTAAIKDALLVCDTTEMTDALTPGWGRHRMGLIRPPAVPSASCRE